MKEVRSAMPFLSEISQAPDESPRPRTSPSDSSLTPEIRQRERADSLTCPTLLHHSKLSGFEVVSKLKHDSEEGTVLQPGSDFPLETMTDSPIRSRRVVPVQVIEFSPNQVSPVKETPCSRPRYGTPPLSPTPRSSAEPGVELPRFTAVNPKVTKLNLSRENVGSLTLRDSAARTSMRPLEAKQDNRMFVPLFSETNCDEGVNYQSQVRMVRPLAHNANSVRPQFSNAPAQVPGNNAFSLGKGLLDGPFTRRNPAPKRRTPAIGMFKLGGFAKQSIKSEKKNVCPDESVVTPDQRPQKDFASFLPKNLSMLSQTDDFSFGMFGEQFRREPGSTDGVLSPSVGDLSLSRLEMPVVFGNSFGRTGSLFSGAPRTRSAAPASTSPKHGRCDEGESIDKEVKRKSPRIGEPSEEVNAAPSRRYTAPPFSGTTSLDRDSLFAVNSPEVGGFSTPIGQMWQDLSTPPFLQAVSS